MKIVSQFFDLKNATSYLFLNGSLLKTFIEMFYFNKVDGNFLKCWNKYRSTENEATAFFSSKY